MGKDRTLIMKTIPASHCWCHCLFCQDSRPQVGGPWAEPSLFGGIHGTDSKDDKQPNGWMSTRKTRSSSGHQQCSASASMFCPQARRGSPALPPPATLSVGERALMILAELQQQAKPASGTVSSLSHLLQQATDKLEAGSDASRMVPPTWKVCLRERIVTSRSKILVIFH